MIGFIIKKARGRHDLLLFVYRLCLHIITGKLRQACDLRLLHVAHSGL